VRCLRKRRDGKTLAWWLAVLAVALAIKHHYSVASAADLQWMLRPLSLLLEWISGHAFHRDSLHEWVSESADIRLVKACAGINFLLMSLLAWAWVFRPDRGDDVGVPTRVAGRILLLLAVIVAAWTTALLANSLRILVAMNLPGHGAGLHRLIGMLIYVPLLSLQLHLGDRDNWRAALAGPVILYLVLMAVVPVLTGNAFNSPGRFIEHLLYLAVMTTIMGCLYARKRGALSKGDHPHARIIPLHHIEVVKVAPGRAHGDQAGGFLAIRHR
jgi:exosortase K